MCIIFITIVCGVYFYSVGGIQGRILDFKLGGEHLKNWGQFTNCLRIVYIHIILEIPPQIKIPGADPGGRGAAAPPPQIGKNMIFLA
jgi:hypothetical protein